MVKALIIVRQLELDAEGNQCPVVPVTWFRDRWESADAFGPLIWFSIWPDFETERDRFVNALWVRDSAGQPMEENGLGVFIACSDDIAALRWLKNNVPYAYTIKEVRQGATVVAQRIRDNWLDDRTDPGQDLAALRTTIAGFDYPDAAEDTNPGDI